jgi:hypothetical protein
MNGKLLNKSKYHAKGFARQRGGLNLAVGATTTVFFPPVGLVIDAVIFAVLSGVYLKESMLQTYRGNHKHDPDYIQTLREKLRNGTITGDKEVRTGNQDGGGDATDPAQGKDTYETTPSCDMGIATTADKDTVTPNTTDFAISYFTDTFHVY